MRFFHFIITSCLSLLFLACGSTRLPDAVTERENCPARVEENAYIPGLNADKVIKNPRPGFNQCYLEKGLKHFAREVACDSGFALVSLVNIHRPGFFAGPCFKADLEFYKTDTGVLIAESPLLRYDSIPAKGWQIYLRLNGGTVLDGLQEETGLISDNGDTASTSKAGFYVGMRYFFLPYLGLELETGGLFSSANAENTKSMNLYNAWSSNFGLALIPWQRMILAGRLQTVVSGGISFTSLTLAEDYKSFLFDEAAILAVDDAATGLGWFTGGGIRMITRLGLLADIGLRYSQEYPKFPKGTRAFTASNLFFDLGLGYGF